MNVRRHMFVRFPSLSAKHIPGLFPVRFFSLRTFHCRVTHFPFFGVRVKIVFSLFAPLLPEGRIVRLPEDAEMSCLPETIALNDTVRLTLISEPQEFRSSDIEQWYGEAHTRLNSATYGACDKGQLKTCSE